MPAFKIIETTIKDKKPEKEGMAAKQKGQRPSGGMANGSVEMFSNLNKEAHAMLIKKKYVEQSASLKVTKYKLNKSGADVEAEA